MPSRNMNGHVRPPQLHVRVTSVAQRLRDTRLFSYLPARMCLYARAHTHIYTHIYMVHPFYVKASIQRDACPVSVWTKEKGGCPALSIADTELGSVMALPMFVSLKMPSMFGLCDDLEHTAHSSKASMVTGLPKGFHGHWAS
jgi:hypothetical protein